MIGALQPQFDCRRRTIGLVAACPRGSCWLSMMALPDPSSLHVPKMPSQAGRNERKPCILCLSFGSLFILRPLPRHWKSLPQFRRRPRHFALACAPFHCLALPCLFCDSCPTPARVLIHGFATATGPPFIPGREVHRTPCFELFRSSILRSLPFCDSCRQQCLVRAHESASTDQFATPKVFRSAPPFIETCCATAF